MTEEQLLTVQCIEECNEVAQALSKCLRFGFYNRELDNKDNFCKVQEEYNDLIASLQLLDRCLNSATSLITTYPVNIDAKKKKVYQMLKRSKELGVMG